MKSERPRISILIPCYGHARFLSDAVESLVAQTYPEWECVIINDGSPDDTSTVARQLISRFPRHRIRLIEQENQGLPASRNAGAAASSGEFLLPLDADDKLAPRMLERTLACLDGHPEKSIAYTDIASFGRKEDAHPSSEEPFEHITRMNTVPVTALIRRELFDRAGGYRAAMRDGYEDWDFWLSCAEQGAQTAHVPAPLFLHRAETGSLIAHAQQRDAELKARLVHQHPGLFTQVQTQWAHTLLGILRMKGTAPPLQGQSFSRVGELPNDAEAYADLGSVAIWDGDIAGGVLKWAEACCSPMPSYLLYAQLTHAVNQLGLTGSFAKAMERVHPVSRQE